MRKRMNEHQSKALEHYIKFRSVKDTAKKFKRTVTCVQQWIKLFDWASAVEAWDANELKKQRPQEIKLATRADHRKMISKLIDQMDKVSVNPTTVNSINRLIQLDCEILDNEPNNEIAPNVKALVESIADLINADPIETTKMKLHEAMVIIEQQKEIIDGS